MSKSFTHLNDRGEANMVNIGTKAETERSATAEGKVRMQPATLEQIQSGTTKKGDVLAVSRIAGIQAAKKCADLIPLCHPLMLTHVDIDFDMDEINSAVKIKATCRLTGKTGVEMEALTAVSVAALTLYDMCKAADKLMVIDDIKLTEKSGGKSGHWKIDAK